MLMHRLEFFALLILFLGGISALADNPRIGVSVLPLQTLVEAIAGD